MGRREELIAEANVTSHPGSLAVIHAERQALALEGIEDLLRVQPAAVPKVVGNCSACEWLEAGAPPRKCHEHEAPRSVTSAALIAATENTVPMEAWKKATFSTFTDGPHVLVIGGGFAFDVSAYKRDNRAAEERAAVKLADLLNRHWDE